MQKKIDSILDRVKDPESMLSVADLGLVKRVRHNQEQKKLFIFTDFVSHKPSCMTCVGISMVITASISRMLLKEFRREFPDLTPELVE